jgi:hypothetical protein
MTELPDPPSPKDGGPAVPSTESNDFMSAALECAARDWRVHPLHGIHKRACTCGRVDCAAPGKHPRLSDWPNKATADPVAIREWWIRWPEANIGVLTGSASGIVVLDVDPRNGGDNSLAGLVAAHGALPATPQSRTGGGGAHFYFAHPGGEVKTWHPRPGLDLQGDGGRYIVVPPSRHLSGRVYAWAENADPASALLAPLPAWLTRPEPTPQVNATDATRESGGRPSTGDLAAPTPWAEAALREECDSVAKAEKGNRNNTLNRAAFSLGQLVPHLLDQGRVEAALLAAASTCGLLEDDGERAVNATLKSGLEDGMRKPRGPRSYEFDHATHAPRAVGAAVDDTGTGARPPRVFNVRGQQIALADEALDALARDHNSGVYVRARFLVRVARESRRRPRGARRPPGAPAIERFSEAALCDRLARLGIWLRRRARDQIEILPPEWLVKNILARSRWPFPTLEGVIESPTMRPDGSILDCPGHDEASGLLYLPTSEYPLVPAAPTGAQVRDALLALLDPIRDFPFRDESDRAAAVAAMLTITARHAIEGCAPLFAIRAPAPGTGKSLLADVIALIGTGRRAARMSHESDDTEMRKRILAIAIEGTPLVLLDNVDGRLGSPSLAAALTAETWADRVLGLSLRAEAPLTSTWLVTGNNLGFQGDLGRRVVPVDMDARQEHPEDRSADIFKHPTLCEYVERERPRLVVAALTLLRGYHVAGRPPHGRDGNMGSFEAWDKFVRGACVWAALADPAGGRDRLRHEDDIDRAALAAALAACRQAFERRGFTASEAARVAESNRELADALLELTGRDKLDGRSIGNALRGVRGRIVDGMKFGTTGREHKTTRWCVEPT